MIKQPQANKILEQHVDTPTYSKELPIKCLTKKFLVSQQEIQD